MPAASSPPDGISIRPLSSQADYQACLALQRETWGADFNDAVAPSILLVAQKVGGVSAGAFDARGTLLGFVFGLTGVERGRVVHWSDMLAVRPEARNLGLGRRLKEFQREAVARLGAHVIYWTYDPLVARNAHLNFNVFGVRVVEYVRDMYGADTGSDLHRGIGTDRLVVAWPVDDGEQERRRAETRAARERSELLGAPVLGDADSSAGGTDPRATAFIRIAVPADITDLMNRDPGRAVTWRERTRAAFQAALAAGHHVAGFVADAARGRGFYLLTRPSPSSPT